MNRLRTRFIASQRLFVLEAPPHLRKDCLNPNRFRKARLSDSDNDAEPHQSRLPEKCTWRQVGGEGREQEREQFLGCEPHRGVLLTDAGVGKTTAIRQTQELWHARGPEYLAVILEFASLPETVEAILAAITEHVAAVLGQDDGDSFATEFRRSIGMLQFQQRFTLLVDALDQTRAKQNTEQMAEALSLFLQKYPGIRCLVSGRPYTIERYWKPFFGSGRCGHWDFIQIAEFDPAEQQQFLGVKRYSQLQFLEADVMSVPRALEALLRIQTADLPRLRTASDVYWESIDVMLDEADELQSGTISRKHAEFLFAMLAFECILQEHRSNQAGLSGRPLETFLETVWKRREQVLEPFLKRLGLSFEQALGRLGQLNEMLDHAVLESAAQPDLVQLYWRNQTILDFFAALWVSRWATEEDVACLSLRRFVLSDKSTHDFHELWKLAAEMPVRGLRSEREVLDCETWARSLGCLYMPTQLDTDGNTIHAIRSTEIIFRSWPTMLFLSGYLEGILDEPRPPQWSIVFHKGIPQIRIRNGCLERTKDPGKLKKKNVRSSRIRVRAPLEAFEKLVELATSRAQHEVRTRVMCDDITGIQSRGAARHALASFLSEYWHIHEGRDPFAYRREFVERPQLDAIDIDYFDYLHDQTEIPTQQISRKDTKKIARIHESGFAWAGPPVEGRPYPRIARSPRKRNVQKWLPPRKSDTFEFWFSIPVRGISEKVQHSFVEARYQINESPVTNELYGLFDLRHIQPLDCSDGENSARGYLFSSPFKKGPATRLSWYDSWCVATWLGGRLPEDREWEYACRAKPGVESQPEVFWWGNDKAWDKHSWSIYNSSRKVGKHFYRSHSAPVGAAGHWNGFALSDMIGLIKEWTCDSIEDLARRIMRGGYYDELPEYNQTSFRDVREREWTHPFVGCRVVRGDMGIVEEFLSDTCSDRG